MNEDFNPWRARQGPQLKSSPCTYAALASPALRRWAGPLKHGWQLHRKLWEWYFICEALYERGVLRPGSRGLGFAVGEEPLAALFAAAGCEVVATDLHPEKLSQYGQDWSVGNQHAGSLDALNKHGVCPAEQFAERVRLRYVDMNDIPADLTGFDFVWSSCSFEHLGSIEHGKRFIENMTRCLKPGGVAVHTTEFNVYSDDATLETGTAVIFRRRDVEEMAVRLARCGARMVERDYFLGDTYADLYVDRPPLTNWPHLKVEIGGFVATSFGVIVEKNK